ncbi:MAG: hypothetical protein ABIT76_11885 [Chthoniobacterales bacterium]
MKIPVPYLLTAAVLASLAWMLPLGAQSPAGTSDELVPLVQAITAQQKLIDENQASIDKSLATIQEDLRQAKIYVSRAGKAKGTK